MTRQRLALSLLAGTVLLCAGYCCRTPATAFAQVADANSYTPLAPPEAYQAALRSNLKITRDWVEMKDFQSAAQSQRLVAALAQLYALRSDDDKHKEQAAALRSACDKAATVLRTKNAETSKQTLQVCDDLVASMTKTPPAEQATHKNFRPFGNVQTWMMLMDCSIIDAKEAKTAEEFQQQTLAVAEQANVTQFLRTEAKWRKFAEETRLVALNAAAASKKDGLEAGRGELKKIGQTCTACHQGYKRS